MSNLILFFYLSLASARPALLPAVPSFSSPSLSPSFSPPSLPTPTWISFLLCARFCFLFVLYSFLASALIPFSSCLVSGISHTLAASFLCSAIMIWLKMGIFVPANVDSQLKSMACTIGAFPMPAKDYSFCVSPRGQTHSLEGSALGSTF